MILASEGAREQAINLATGEAEAIFRTAEATARSLGLVSAALQQSGGEQAASLRVAEKYLEVCRCATVGSGRGVVEEKSSSCT